jgi:hypothetical protein
MAFDPLSKIKLVLVHVTLALKGIGVYVNLGPRCRLMVNFTSHNPRSNNPQYSIRRRLSGPQAGLHVLEKRSNAAETDPSLWVQNRNIGHNRVLKVLTVCVMVGADKSNAVKASD